MKGFVEIPLLDMIEKLGEDHVRKILSDFLCPQSKDVEYYIKNRAIEFAKQKITQTQLVFLTYKNETRLAAYYSLTNKSLCIKDDAFSKTWRIVK